MKRIYISLLCLLFCLTSLFSASYTSSVSKEGILQIVSTGSDKKEVAVDKKVEDAPSEIELLRSQLEVQKGEIEALKSEIARLTTEEENTTAKSQKFQFVSEDESVSEDDKLEEKIAAYENALKEYDSTVKALETQIANIKSSLKALPEAFNDFEDSVNDKIEAIPDPVNPFLKNGIFFDMHANATLVRQKDPVFGVSFNFGYRDRINLYSIYGRFDYFMVPLGSKTGRLGTIEFNAEAGANFSFVISAQDWQETKLSIDIGYYSQWYERSGLSSVFFLGYNGLMLRPGISTKANLVLFKVEMGLYYQVATYPRYSDYDGFGVYVKIF